MKLCCQVPGKIVVYNQDYHGYGVSVAYRAAGAARAAKLGAVASLIRSVTPLSVASPHTGMQVGLYDCNNWQMNLRIMVSKMLCK